MSYRPNQQQQVSIATIAMTRNNMQLSPAGLSLEAQGQNDLPYPPRQILRPTLQQVTVNQSHGQMQQTAGAQLYPRQLLSNMVVPVTEPNAPSQPMPQTQQQPNQGNRFQGHPVQLTIQGEGAYGLDDNGISPPPSYSEAMATVHTYMHTNV
ncbi:uncharacterized protein LOC144453070 [Glandiceps talaboti]